MLDYEHARSIYEIYIEPELLSLPSDDYEHLSAHIQQRLRLATHSVHKIFSRARQLVLAHLESLYLVKFLSWHRFVDFAQNEVVTAQDLKQQNDRLIVQLARAQADLENLTTEQTEEPLQ
jgi:cell shape-determining protein MreC